MISCTEAGYNMGICKSANMVSDAAGTSVDFMA